MCNKIQVMRTVKGQLILFLFFLSPLVAQQFEFGWAEKQEYANNKNGFFNGYIHTSDTYVYVLNSNYAVSPINKNNKLKLIAYNKFTMSEAASVALIGYPENSASKSNYQDLAYFRTVVLADRILVFWTKLINTDSTRTEELYAESFATDLDRDQPLRKVYTSTQRVDSRQSDFSPSSIVVSWNKERDDLLIGSELCQAADNAIFTYTILGSKLRSPGERQVILPATCDPEKGGVSCLYDYGKDGNIYVRSTVTLTREQRKEAPEDSPRAYFVFTAIHPESGKRTSIEMRGEHKTITDFSYIATGTKTKIFGFFGDLLKDTSGIDKQGIFHAELNSESLNDAALNYSYFEKTTLNKLFPRTKGGRKKVVEKPNEEELNTRFDIESIFPMDDGSYVLFFNRKYNYSEITSKSGGDGRNVYKTDRYCEKNNVSAIRITDNGKILWTSNVDRTITYNGTDIADLKVVYKWNKFYVIYGTEDPAAPARMKKKQAAFRDNVDYAIFDPASGRAKKHNLPVNEKGVPKAERRTIDPLSIRVFDDNYYFSMMVVRQKTAWYVANVLFFPSIYYSVLSGNTKQGTGELGVLRLIDEKAAKKTKGKK